MTRLTSTLALAGVAAVGLYLPSMGLPLAMNSCRPTLGVANAAPSPTCASDLRECLRQSADIRQTTFGGRYVTAEDVARCTEAFNACIHGTGQGGGTPPSTPSSGGAGRNDLPQRFAIRMGDGTVTDCRVSGTSVNCSESWPNLPDGTDSYSGSVSGTLSGMTMAGNYTSHQEGHTDGCRWEQDFTGPVTYDFRGDGTATVRLGPYRQDKRGSGSCTYADSTDLPAKDFTATWSAIK